MLRTAMRCSSVLPFVFLFAATGTYAGSSSPPLQASAELKSADGKDLGTVGITETDRGLVLSVRAHGLSPGAHGIHIHENGKCEGPDFKSAGSHYGSVGKEHGLRNKKGPHAGDLPNLEVGPDGTALAEMTTRSVTLKEGPNSLFKSGGTSVVIHEKADDQKTSPAGNSGGRIACGVIVRK